MRSDRITISQLRLTACIGVYTQEQGRPQQLTVDIVLWLNLSNAATSDLISKTVDYDQVIETIQTHTLGRHFQLIETLANELAERLLNTFPRLRAVRVRLFKFPALPVARVGVILTRHRRTNMLQKNSLDV